MYITQYKLCKYLCEKIMITAVADKNKLTTTAKKTNRTGDTN